MRAVWFSIFLAALGWGTSSVAVRGALGEGMGPYAIATYRSLIGALAVVGFLVVMRRGLPRGKATWKTGLVQGVTNLAVPYILLNIALQHASAGFVGLLVALIPMLTAVLAHFMLPSERLNVIKVLGLSVAAGGVGVLLLSGDSGLADGGRPALALLLGFLGALSIAYGGTYAKIHAGDYAPLHVTGIHFVLGAVVIAVAALIVEGPAVPKTVEAWSLMAYLGLLGQFMPFVLFYRLLQKVSATYASMVGYVVPLIAVTAGVIVLDERLQVGIILGGLLILAGVLITDRSERIGVIAAEGAPEELVAGRD